MAELGDLLTGGSERSKEVTVEMLDYDFLDKCVDTGLMRAIVRKLRSGEEGHYPHLLKHAEKRLLDELPPPERSKILRMKAEPQLDEIYQATNDLRDWEVEMARTSMALETEKHDRRAPGWSSNFNNDSEECTPTVDEIRTQARSEVGGEGANGVACSRQSNPEQPTSKRINAYDFRAWEKYDVEGELSRLEDEDNEDQRMQREVITTAQARAEQEERRRARRREKQIEEARKGRFKKPLSVVEQKRAANRERLKGNESFKAKEFEEAFRCYTCSLALDASNARVHSNRAAAAHKLERLAEAEDDCTRAIALDREFKKAWMRRGMVRHSRGKYVEAVSDFSEALRLDPSDTCTLKLREHSSTKAREVGGEAALGKTGSRRKGGRILIEEVEYSQDVGQGQDNGEDQEYAITCPTEVTPPPILPTSCKRTTIAHGWIEQSTEDLKEHPPRIQKPFANGIVTEGTRRVEVYESDSEDEEVLTRTIEGDNSCSEKR